MWRTLGRPFLWTLGKLGDNRRRRHGLFLVLGLLAAAGGLLAYGLVSPEIPFAQAPVKLVRELHADEVVKIYGRIECNCSKAVNREEAQVGATGRTWNATYVPFTVDDPSGKMFIDTSSVTRLTRGPTGGDWVDGDMIAVYGSVYDQGNGALALRAQMMAKAPDDTPAVFAFDFEVVAALGGLSIAVAVTDRLLFGGALQ